MLYFILLLHARSICSRLVCAMFPHIANIITMESTKKLQAMISAVSTMLLKGLHGATSIASYGIQQKKQKAKSEDQHTTNSKAELCMSNSARDHCTATVHVFTENRKNFLIQIKKKNTVRKKTHSCLFISFFNFADKFLWSTPAEKNPQ